MGKTKEAEEAGAFTSPTSAAPILVGFDGSEEGRDALELGRVLGSIRDCRCIVALPETDRLAEQARRALGDPDVEIKEIGILSPALQLVECAKREHAGTLVVGSSHRGAIGRALAGSVGGQLFHKAPCEVVIAPRGYGEERHPRFAKVAVAVDGSPGSKIALTRAEDLAREAGASIEVLVAEDPAVSGIEAEFPSDAPSSMSDVLQAALGAVDPALSPTGKRVDTGWHKIARTIAAALAGACEDDVDLLVVGSRRPFERFLTGSVTTHLIAEAPVPVLVVPHAG